MNQIFALYNSSKKKMQNHSITEKNISYKLADTPTETLFTILFSERLSMDTNSITGECNKNYNLNNIYFWVLKYAEEYYLKVFH